MGDTPPNEMLAATGQRQAMLLAQCTLAPKLSEDAIANCPINVIEMGAEGSEVLFIHGGVQGGLGGGPETFSKQQAMAEDGWRLRFVERPGFGQSPSRGADDMEGDAVWIADMLGNGVHLIGHSWGGADALLAAARRPEAVRSLTLIEPSLFPVVMTDPELRADPQMQAVAGRLGQLMMQSTTPAEYALKFAQTVLGPEDDPDVAEKVSGLRANAAIAHEVGCSVLQAKMASPMAMRAATHVVAENKIPTLVVTGGWAPFFDKVGHVVARFTGGHHEVVRASNHMVQEVSSESFNALLSQFMRSAESPSSSGR